MKGDLSTVKCGAVLAVGGDNGGEFWVSRPHCSMSVHRCACICVCVCVCACALFPVLARVVGVVMPSDISASPIATP